MYINSSPAITYDATVQLLTRYVRLYIESGELSERFAALDKEEVRYGSGFDITTILSATKNATGTKLAEHGSYPPNAFTLRFSNEVGGQYGVSIDELRVQDCVGDEEKIRQYAAELTESLYQGYFDDKNAAIATEAAKIIAQSAKSSVAVTLGTDTKQYALDVLTEIKAAVEDIREGITGTSYGNTLVAGKRIAARDVIIIMSNSLAALLDTNGYARVFSPEYLQAANVVRITSNRIAENTVLITDTRNIQVRRHKERFVGPIENSDGTMNYFYNKYDFIEAAVATDTTYSGQVAFPFKVITTTEE